MSTEPSRNRLAVGAIEQILETMILSGEFGPGEHINENALASRLGVGRAPVREACRLLERSNLIRILPNQGAFVSSLTLAEVINLFDIRASLGRLAGQEVAARITSAKIEELRKMTKFMEVAARERDADGYVSLNIEFHAAIYAAADNARLAHLDGTLGKELRLYRRHGLAYGGGLFVSNREHQLILSAMERGDCEEAGILLERHIHGGRDRFLRAMSATGQLMMQPPLPDVESVTRETAVTSIV